MNFDRIAPYYRWMERLSAGTKLQSCRVAFLDEIPVPNRVLLAGEGHGRFLPECVRKFPAAEITVIDSSARMLEIARRSITAGQVNFLHIDVREWQAPAGIFDLVVTNFFLDCFTADELAEVVEKLGQSATPQADWLLADFEVAPRGLAKWRSRWIIRTLYTFFRMTSGLEATALVPPEAALERAGFRRRERKTYDWGLLKSEWWQRETAGDR